MMGPKKEMHMETEYHVQMDWKEGRWQGVLSGDGREVPFCGLDELIQTQLRLDLRELRSLAWVDPLTGLLNRRGLENGLARAAGEEVGLLFLDVDELKRINDIWGHLRGDHALKRVSWQLEQLTRPGDLAGRIGGDEFVVVLRNVGSRDELKRLGEKLCRDIAEAESELGLSVSVGACWEKAGPSLTQLLERADWTLNQAKRRGKNQVVLYGEKEE